MPAHLFDRPTNYSAPLICLSQVTFPNRIWRIVWPVSHLECFDDQFAVLNPVSWETHFIPLAAAEVLKLLTLESLTFQQLAKEFGVEAEEEQNSEECVRLLEILSGLKRQGLVSDESFADVRWFDCACVGEEDVRVRANA